MKQETTSHHTLTPWRWDRNWLIGANSETIAWYTTDDDGVHCKKCDKDFIVEACNAYEKLKADTAALIEALKKSKYALLDVRVKLRSVSVEPWPWLQDEINKTQVALAKVGAL